MQIVVLAGDRGPGDPLAESAAVAGKVLVPIHGRPMLAYVLDAISGLENVAGITLVCPGRAAYLAAIDGFDCRRIDPADGPAASVAAALACISSDAPVLLCTGDHPLLRGAWLRQFLRRAGRSGADVVVGLVDWQRVQQRFPDSPRTRYRFADAGVCGTNLFYFANARGRRIVDFWRKFESDRKRPWKIVARLGWWNLLRYRLGRLERGQALAALSKRFGARLDSVLIDDPLACVDVDTAHDLELVTGLLSERRGSVE